MWLSSPTSLGQLAKEYQAFTCLYLLSLCCWNYKWEPSCLTFCMVSGDSTQVFTLARQTFTNWAISPMLLTYFLKSSLSPSRMITLQPHNTFRNHLFVEHLLCDLPGYGYVTKETVFKYNELLAVVKELLACQYTLHHKVCTTKLQQMGCWEPWDAWKSSGKEYAYSYNMEFHVQTDWVRWTDCQVTIYLKARAICWALGGVLQQEHENDMCSQDRWEMPSLHQEGHSETVAKTTHYWRMNKCLTKCNVHTLLDGSVKILAPAQHEKLSSYHAVSKY